jgi:hypothetical protein
LSKILEAKCSPGKIVDVGGVPVSIAEVFSEGTAPSEGLLILVEGKAYYLTSSASDLKALIARLSEITQAIITIATGLDAVTTAPGSQAASIAQLTALKVELEASQEVLK